MLLAWSDTKRGVMRVLVTGGAGFVGSHYVRALLGQAGPAVEIVVLVRLTHAGSRANLEFAGQSSRLTIVEGDICDSLFVNNVMKGIHHVVNFAAETHVDRSIDSPSAFLTNNVVGTQTLLHAAVSQGVERFVHVSTGEVYGSIDSGSCDERQKLRPSTPYGASKAGSDHIVEAYHKTYGLATLITRCSNNYGPYQFPEKLIPRFVTALFEGRNVPLYGDGGNIREWLYVEDHCRAVELVRASGTPGEIYNIGGGRSLTNHELTSVLLEACGVGWDRVTYVPDRRGHDYRHSLDGTKLHRELGFRPRVEFDTGLARTVKWFVENRSWWVR